MPQRILILNPPGGELDLLKRAFETACASSSRIFIAEEVKQVLEAIHGDGYYDLVVLDFFLGDGVLSGREVLGQLRAVDEQIPVLGPDVRAWLRPHWSFVKCDMNGC